jgi:SagB-type dehydrogenase family enzyme
MKNKIKPNTNLNEYLWESDKFHSLVDNKKDDLLLKSKPATIPRDWIDINFKTYPRLKSIPLDPGLRISELEKTLIKRTSNKIMGKKEIDLKTLSHLLFYSAGITHRADDLNMSRRPYPSAGGRYPLEIYAAVLRGKDIKEGLYHYNVKRNMLELLLEKYLQGEIKNVIGYEDWILNSSVIFFITGILDRNRTKYHNRGYLYTLLEAGHMAQNICLIATKLNLKVSPLGGFANAEVARFIDILNSKEKPIYAIVVGK